MMLKKNIFLDFDSSLFTTNTNNILKSNKHRRQKLKNVAILMAGGRGERFWPHSRFDMPKQLLSITGDECMVRKTVDRLSPFICLADIYISTTEDLFNSIKDTLPEIDYLNYILEPIGRDTAACIGLSAIILQHRYKNSNTVMIALPVDHIIKEKNKFLNALEGACNLARETGNLITIGIKPLRPETGYGYILLGKEIKKNEKVTAYEVKKFTEKPDLETAKYFLKQGNYLWNSGIFVWTCKDILDAIEKEMPELFNGLVKIRKHLGTLQKRKTMKEVFSKLNKISIDYAILEKVSNRLVVKGDFGWDDVGSWTSMDRIFHKDKNENVVQGGYESVDTKKCVVINDKGLIVTIGLHDLVIISNGDIKLIYPKNRENDLKKIIEKITNHEDYKKYI